MALKLKTVEGGEGLDALRQGVEVLLGGIGRHEAGWLPKAAGVTEHRAQFEVFRDRILEEVKQAMYVAYAGASSWRLEEILRAGEMVGESVRPGSSEGEMRSQALAWAILRSTQGARHERLSRRLAAAWESGAQPHPAVALAVKAAVFHEPVSVAQAAYLFQEWRASAPGDLQVGGFSGFLESQPAEEVLSISPPGDPHSPFGKLRHHG